MIDTVIVYRPGGTSVNPYVPSAKVFVLFDGSTSSTRAPAMGAPVRASTTTPWTADCACGPSQKLEAKSQKENAPVIRPQPDRPLPRSSLRPEGHPRPPRRADGPPENPAPRRR